MKSRTIDTFCDEIKADDPNTAITKSAVRRALQNGDIPSRRIGVKYVFDRDTALAYFCGEDVC